MRATTQDAEQGRGRTAGVVERDMLAGAGPQVPLRTGGDGGMTNSLGANRSRSTNSRPVRLFPDGLMGPGSPRPDRFLGPFKPPTARSWGASEPKGPQLPLRPKTGGHGSSVSGAGASGLRPPSPTLRLGLDRQRPTTSGSVSAASRPQSPKSVHSLGRTGSSFEPGQGQSGRARPPSPFKFEALRMQQTGGEAALRDIDADSTAPSAVFGTTASAQNLAHPSALDVLAAGGNLGMPEGYQMAELNLGFPGLDLSLSFDHASMSRSNSAEAATASAAAAQGMQVDPVPLVTVANPPLAPGFTEVTLTLPPGFPGGHVYLPPTLCSPEIGAPDVGVLPDGNSGFVLSTDGAGQGLGVPNQAATAATTNEPYVPAGAQGWMGQSMPGAHGAFSEIHGGMEGLSLGASRAEAQAALEAQRQMQGLNLHAEEPEPMDTDERTSGDTGGMQGGGQEGQGFFAFSGMGYSAATLPRKRNKAKKVPPRFPAGTKALGKAFTAPGMPQATGASPSFTNQAEPVPPEYLFGGRGLEAQYRESPTVPAASVERGETQFQAEAGSSRSEQSAAKDETASVQFVARGLAGMDIGAGREGSPAVEHPPAAWIDENGEIELRRIGLGGRLANPKGQASPPQQGFQSNGRHNHGGAEDLADTHTSGGGQQFVHRGGSDAGSGQGSEQHGNGHGGPGFVFGHNGQSSDGEGSFAAGPGQHSRSQHGHRHRRHQRHPPVMSRSPLMAAQVTGDASSAHSLESGRENSGSGSMASAQQQSRRSSAAERATTAPAAPAAPAPKGMSPKVPRVGFNPAADQAEKAALKFRQKGNVAYQKKDFGGAEVLYSTGIDTAVPYAREHQGCAAAGALCLSNRAATRIIVGRHREALDDCRQAKALDPTFVKAAVRAASCLLALGELDKASAQFEECLREIQAMQGSAQVDPADQRHATEGLGKAKEAQVCTAKVRSVLVQRRGGVLSTITNITAAAADAGGARTEGASGEPAGQEGESDPEQLLKKVNKALGAAVHSEELLQLKAELLLWCRRFEDVFEMCEKTLPFAERNHGRGAAVAPGQAEDSQRRHVDLKAWRLEVQGRAKLGMGLLEEALELLQEAANRAGALARPSGASGRAIGSSSASALESTIRELLRLKAAGNEEYQAAKHAEAISHYTACLCIPEISESWPFQAVCLCNRAATSQAVGDLVEAIADCSRAIALEPKYMKAISRRATLSEIVRDYARVVSDLRRLLELSEEARRAGSATGSFSLSMSIDPRETLARIQRAEGEQRSRTPVDYYLLLGLDISCSEKDVKKAYHKAALRYHPDKVALLLAARVDTSVAWGKRVEAEEKDEAERIFKLIGEAHGVLSDKAKRAKYDEEEQLRRMRSLSTAGLFSTASASSFYGGAQPAGAGAGVAVPRRRNWEGQSWQDIFNYSDPRQPWYKNDQW